MADFRHRHDIQTCRDHHAVLRELVDGVPAAAPVEPEAAAGAIARLRLVLLRHLHLEDTWLYPALETLDQPGVAAAARRYREEMGGLSTAFVAFADRWTGGPIAAAPEDYLRAWLPVRALLHQRMDAEDDDLYELAEGALRAGA